MKAIYRLMLLAFATIMTTGFVACDDEFSESVFDTVEHPLDRTSYTFPLDTFVKVNYLEPYNLRFIYKMEDVGSDKDKNLVPARYEQSKKLAVLSKYLWYDVYEKYAGLEFLKENSPRIIHVIGSKSLNPSQGTETLGVAEGGIKITLYGANEIDMQPTEHERVDYMTKYFYNTMHHEFGHILDQTKLHPTTFNTISAGKYDAMGWGNTPDSVSCGKGFVSSYASKSYSEDLVETAASYITLDTLRWNVLLSCSDYEWEYIDSDYTSEDAFNNAFPPSRVYRDTVGYYKRLDSGGSKIYRKLCKRDADGHVVLGEKWQEFKKHETIIINNVINVKLTDEDLNTDTHDCDYENCPHTNLNNQYTAEEKEELLLKKINNELSTKVEEKLASLEAISKLVDGFNWSDEDKQNLQNKIDELLKTVNIGNYSSVYIQIASACSDPINNSKQAIDGHLRKSIEWLHESGINGREIIMSKLNLVRSWLNDNFGYSIDDIRREVQQRQWLTDADGNFVIESDPIRGKRLVNRLTHPDSNDPQGRTLMEVLLDQVEVYKELQK